MTQGIVGRLALLLGLAWSANWCHAQESPSPQSPADKSGTGPAEAQADERDKTPEKSKDGKPADSPRKDEKPGLLDQLSRELFKELDDGTAAKTQQGQPGNKLERAAQGMRNAGNKLSDAATGDETREIQQQVIKDLEELIRQMQNPPPPQGGGGGGGGGGGSRNQQNAGGGGSSSRLSRSQGQRGSAQGRRQQGGQSERDAQANASDKGTSQGGQEKSKAEGSEERTESERKAAEEAARKKKMEMDVWGHLPPHLREQLLNTYGERMLPKYQHLVKQFYEALSDQSEGPRR